jgi:hypothetical protein
MFRPFLGLLLPTIAKCVAGNAGSAEGRMLDSPLWLLLLDRGIRLDLLLFFRSVLLCISEFNNAAGVAH